MLCRAEQKESKKVEKQAKALEAESAAKAKDKESEKEKPKEEKKEKEEKPKEEAQKDKEQKPKEEKPKEKPSKTKDQPKEDDKKDEPQPTPLTVKPAQNWCDFFFIIDSMSYNIDACDFILFMNKLHPVPNIDIKKVNVEASYLETTTNTLVFSYSDAGIMESLLGESPFSSGNVIRRTIYSLNSIQFLANRQGRTFYQLERTRQGYTSLSS